LEEKLAFSYSKDLLEENLADFNFIKIYEGWIPKRFHEVQDKTFSFVHIDVDLYEPTKESLDFFYSRLAPKGIIVCDDYNFCQFPGAKKAFDEFLENNNPSFFYEVPYGASFIIK
jgi:predicted O-methyltransferase YrrM